MKLSVKFSGTCLFVPSSYFVYIVMQSHDRYLKSLLLQSTLRGRRRNSLSRRSKKPRNRRIKPNLTKIPSPTTQDRQMLCLAGQVKPRVKE